MGEVVDKGVEVDCYAYCSRPRTFIQCAYHIIISSLLADLNLAALGKGAREAMK